MQDAKEEVRARLNIEDVIGEYVQLKRAGRNFKGLSPFTDERTPSFFVSPDKNIWHDFSSNKGGDIFSFIMEVEGMDFRQALEHLARKAGVELELYESSKSKQLAIRKKRALEAHRLAANYYQKCLLSNKHAMEYVFGKRKLNKTVVRDFQIGYAPNAGNALVNALIKKGFTKKELNDAGLVNRFGGDMFRGRIMIPLMDSTGQVIGFTGRIIEDIPNAPKYLNTPQTILYDKSRHIFALSQAKESVRKEDYIVMVEGNLDVVSSHQVNIKQVVATAGTAMTEGHLRAIKRLTGDVRLAYDGDKAGIAATERAIAIASEIGLDLTIVSLPSGFKDPDELIQSDPRKWQQAIDDAVPAIDWILSQYMTRVDISSAIGKRTFTTAGLNIVKLLSDPVEREHYEKKIADMTGSSLKSIQEKTAKNPVKTKELKQINPKATKKVPKNNIHLIEDNLLAISIIDNQSRKLLEKVNPSIFHEQKRIELAKYLSNNTDKNIKDTPSVLQNIDTYVKIILLQADTRYANWSQKDRQAEATRMIRQIENEYKKQNQISLTEQLRQAEDDGNDVLADKLRIELNNLIKEIARGRR